MGKNIPGIHQKCLFLLCHPRGCKSRKKARHLVISGVVAECCVLSTVLSAIDAGCKVIYLTDAVAGLSEVSRKETETLSLTLLRSTQYS